MDGTIIDPWLLVVCARETPPLSGIPETLRITDGACVGSFIAFSI